MTPEAMILQARHYERLALAYLVIAHRDDWYLGAGYVYRQVARDLRRDAAIEADRPDYGAWLIRQHAA